MQPRFTSYERDGLGADEAMFRRYNRWWSRFDQPDPYDGSYNLGDPQSFNRYAYVQNDPVNFVDPLGLDRFDDHLGPPPLMPPSGPLPTVIINTSAPIYGVTGFTGGETGITIEDPPTDGGGDGGGEPQNPVPQGNSSIFDEAYRDCLSKLGNAPAPGVVQAAHVIQISQTTGVDPTLFSVTWYEESRFRYFPENGPHGGGDADIGPGQLHPGTWDKAPYTSGLRNPFGTNRAVGQVFNGNPIENLLLSAYALDSRAGGRAKKAGLYKAGQVGGDGYELRVSRFNKHAKGYDDFFNCLARRGFRAP